jgi:hypothetical protein
MRVIGRLFLGAMSFVGVRVWFASDTWLIQIIKLSSFLMMDGSPGLKKELAC